MIVRSARHLEPLERPPADGPARLSRRIYPLGGLNLRLRPIWTQPQIRSYDQPPAVMTPQCRVPAAAGVAAMTSQCQVLGGTAAFFPSALPRVSRAQIALSTARAAPSSIACR